MISALWWVAPLIATMTALWIFTHNKVGNFNVVPEIREHAKLVITGPYQYVRHPMYSALILFMAGIILHSFSWLNLLFFSIMIVAVALKALKEEKLWHHHDRAYEAYYKKTKMIIPYIF